MKNTVIICMGSSCFSRGNREHVGLIKNYIAENSLDAAVELSGSLCEENCGEGPVVTINGTRFSHVDENFLMKILERELVHE
ncbi:MAG: (2Fe-2S) ferredoxin domain-containing protein [Spirochaetaceae bacterium]